MLHIGFVRTYKLTCLIVQNKITVYSLAYVVSSIDRDEYFVYVFLCLPIYFISFVSIIKSNVCINDCHKHFSLKLNP